MKLIKLIALAVSVFAATTVSAAGKLEIDDAWIRQAPPGMNMTAGYMTIENKTGEAVALTGASSKEFGRIELHRTEVKDGMATMLPQNQVDVPAGGKAMFMPGGLHMMMFDPARELKPGDQVMVELQFANHPPVMAHYVVRAATGGMNMDHGKMDMKH
jgi:copper(I)-binding protein